MGEYLESEMRDNPVFTVADGILWLYQSVERNSIVRKLQVVKMRGQAPMPGLHTFRITGDGIQVFPRMFKREERPPQARAATADSRRESGLDEMLGGGIPEGDCGARGRPVRLGQDRARHPVHRRGAQTGRAGVIAVFEEHPQEYLERARSLGFDLEEMVRQGKLKVIYLRPLDLSVDETLQEIRDAVERDRGQAGGDRLALRLRAGAGADLPRGLPRVALPDGGGADRTRRHGPDDGGGGRGLRRAAASPRTRSPS